MSFAPGLDNHWHQCQLWHWLRLRLVLVIALCLYVFSLGVKRPRREADHSPPSSAEVKNAWIYTSTPQYVFMVWCSVNDRDNLTFYLTYNDFWSHFIIQHSSPSSAWSCGQKSPWKNKILWHTKLINSPKSRKACEIVGIPNETNRHLARRPLVHLTHRFYQ
jgi:hypothetical protein